MYSKFEKELINLFFLHNCLPCIIVCSKKKFIPTSITPMYIYKLNTTVRNQCSIKTIRKLFRKTVAAKGIWFL